MASVLFKIKRAKILCMLWINKKVPHYAPACTSDVPWNVCRQLPPARTRRDAIPGTVGRRAGTQHPGLREGAHGQFKAFRNSK